MHLHKFSEYELALVIIHEDLLVGHKHILRIYIQPLRSFREKRVINAWLVFDGLFNLHSVREIRSVNGFVLVASLVWILRLSFFKRALLPIKYLKSEAGMPTHNAEKDSVAMKW